MMVLPDSHSGMQMTGWRHLLVFLMLVAICLWASLTDNANAAISEAENVVVSYVLTEKDLANLKIDYDINEELSQLQSQTFETKDKYEAAANNFVESAPDEYKGIIAKHLKLPEKTTTYKLTEQSLINLEAGNLPKDILENIKSLQEKTFADSKAFYVAVFTIVPELSKTYLQQIERTAEFRSYKVSGKFYEFLQKENFPSTILTDLQKLKGKEFKDVSQLVNEIRKIIEDEAAIEQVYDYYQKYYHPEPSLDAGHIIEIKKYQLSEPSLVVLKDKKLPENIVQDLRSLKIVDEIFADRNRFVEKIKPLVEKEELKRKKYRAMIFAAAEKSLHYRLGDLQARAIVDELALQQLPDKFIQKLIEIIDIEYPDANVFRSETLLKIREALQQYIELVGSSIEPSGRFELNQQMLDQLGQLPTL